MARKEDDLLKIGLALGGILLFSKYSQGRAEAASGPLPGPLSVSGSPTPSGRVPVVTAPTVRAPTPSSNVTVTSDVVAWVQQSLNFLLDDSIPVDGQWGPQTAALLGTYQSIKGLYRSDRIDNPTIAAINADLSASESLTWGRYPTLPQFMDPNWQPTSSLTEF